MLTCDECEGRVSEYLDGRLPDVETAEMLAHCSQCGGCRAFLDALIRLGIGGRGSRTVNVPSSLDLRIQSAAGEGKFDKPASVFSLARKRVVVPLPAAAVLAILIFAFGMYVALLRREQSHREPLKRQTTADVMSLPPIPITSD
jgi:hypothetical protein